MKYNFDIPVDRFKSHAAKFKQEYLLEIFKTEDLYPFWIADQDFKTSPEIINALVSRAQNGVFGYECKSNTFMSTIVDWYLRRFHCEIKSSWIQFTPTIMSGIAIALDVFTNENDPIIIQPPVYMEFENVIQRTNRKPIYNTLTLHQSHYKVNFNALNTLCSQAENKVIIISNPHNPGGRVWTKSELQQIVNICLENNVLIIADEIHADVVFKPHQFTSFLSFPEIHHQLIVCYSPSKVFNLAGISDSIVLIPNTELHTEFKTLNSRYNLGRTNAFAHTALETGFKTGDNYVDQLNIYLKSNIDYISNYLEKNIPQIKYIRQEGTYLVWLDVKALPIQGEELIHFLAQHAHIGVNIGNKFGAPGIGFIRMNISCPKHIIVTAMDHLKKAIQLMNVQKSEQNC